MAPNEVKARPPDTRREPRERLERAMNTIGAVVIGFGDQLAAEGGEDLLRRVRATLGHLAALEGALARASAPPTAEP